jgi:hypothetical protein
MTFAGYTSESAGFQRLCSAFEKFCTSTVADTTTTADDDDDDKLGLRFVHHDPQGEFFILETRSKSADGKLVVKHIAALSATSTIILPLLELNARVFFGSRYKELLYEAPAFGNGYEKYYFVQDEIMKKLIELRSHSERRQTERMLRQEATHDY